MEIELAQKKVDDWIKSIGVRYFNELTNTAMLMEEVGEFARIVSRKYGEQSFKQELTEKQIEEKLEEELADILFVVICLANQTGINLSTALEKSIKKKTTRDSKRHLNNDKLNES